MNNNKINPSHPRVLVLLACYNGEKYIDAQIKSILNQENVDLNILISDDGSSDNTLPAIESIKSPKVERLASETSSRSAAQNFLKLISAASVENYDYISLSDQDDIWNIDKISRAIDAIKKENVSFYSSNVTAFWDNGKTLLIKKSQPQTRYDYWFEPAGPGCTYVFTKKAAILLQNFIKNNNLNSITMHDWFIYAWARVNNFNWFIDNSSSMLYRQHAINVVGTNVGLKAALTRLRKIRNGWYRTEILTLAKVLNSNDRVICRLRSNNFLDKTWLMFHCFSFRRRLRDKFALFAFILIMK